jgi:hypothetical protein
MASKLGSVALVTHWFPRTAAILALAALASACGAAADERPGYVPADEAEASTSHELETNKSSKKRNVQRDECEAGDAEECRIELPSQGSVKNCIDGVRYCDEGKWSECEVN